MESYTTRRKQNGGLVSANYSIAFLGAVVIILCLLHKKTGRMGGGGVGAGGVGGEGGRVILLMGPADGQLSCVNKCPTLLSMSHPSVCHNAGMTKGGMQINTMSWCVFMCGKGSQY